MTSIRTDSAATTRDWVGLAVVLAATFMGQLDGFIVNVASPTIQRDLPAGFDQIQLVGAAYVFACAAGLVTGGRLGDRFGRRRVFLAGVAAFTLTSLCCGLTPNAELLIGFRFAQGFSAAALIPQELSIVRATFHDDTQRARALGAYGVVLGLGVIAGIAGGGVLVGLGWRTVFLVNIPIGAAILAIGRFTIAESRSATTVRFDTAGAALTALVIPALLLPLILGPRAGWSAWIWVSAGIGALAASVLVRQQRATLNPLYPPHVLATRGFPLSLGTLAVFFAGNAGLFLVFTYHLQAGLGLEPFPAGLMFTPLGVGFAIGSTISGRRPIRPVAGTTLITACLLAFVVVAQLPLGIQHIPLAVLIGVAGLGQGLVVAPLVGGILGRTTPDDAGAASGIASTVVQFGLALGFSVVGVCYRAVLGADPAVGPPDRAAFTVAVLVLAAGAAITGALCVRLGRKDRGTVPAAGPTP